MDKLDILWATDQAICITWQGREILIGSGNHNITIQYHAPASDWVLVHDHTPEDGDRRRVASIMANVTDQPSAK